MRSKVTLFALCLTIAASSAIPAAWSANPEVLARRQMLESILSHGHDDSHIQCELGDCEMELGNYESAADHYQRALMLAPEHHMRLKAKAALDRLKGMGIRPSFIATRVPSTVAAPQPPQPPKPKGPLAPQQSALAAKIQADCDQAIKSKEAYFNRAIEDVERRLKEDMRNVPKKYVDFRHSADNPTYESDIADLQHAANERILKLRYQMEQSRTNILAETKRKLENINATTQHLEQDLKSTTGAVALTKKGTSLHVRNYMSFPDLSESNQYAPPVVPLRATPNRWTPKPAAKANGQK